MAKTAKRKRKPKRAPAKQGRTVDLDIVKDRPPPTPAELRRRKKAQKEWLRKSLEPHAPALEKLGRAVQPWRRRLETWSQDPFGVGHLLRPDPALMRAVKSLRAPAPARTKPAEGQSKKVGRGRPGRPEIWDWETLRSELVELMKGPDKHFEAISDLGEWCRNNVRRANGKTPGDGPDPKTVRTAIEKHQLYKIAGFSSARGGRN
jgi:hypothetical protein